MKKLGLKDLSVFILAAAIIIINVPTISRRVHGAGILALLLAVFLLNLKIYLKGVYGVAALFAFFYVMLEMVYEFLGISKCEYIYYYYTFSFFLIAVIAPPLVEDLNKRQQNILLFATLGSLLFLVVANFQLRNQYGYQYVRLGDYVTDTNAINTQFFSAIVILCGVLFTQLMYSKTRKPLYLALLVILIVFEIYVGQRVIVFSLMFMMLITQVLVRKKRSLFSYILVCVFFALILLALFNLQTILLWVISLLKNSSRIGKRLTQIVSFLQSGSIEGVGGSLEVRINLLGNSLSTAFASPINFIVGIGENRNSNLLIGHHSQWIDQVAKYGVVGTVLMGITLSYCFKSLRTSMRIKGEHALMKQYYVMVGYFFLRGMIGSVLYPYFGIVLFIVLPIFMKRIKAENTISGGKK